ncbi:MAG TPA: nicotinate (nicotinamide) nucleotide adenylyltransferase [Gaiellales bacterium]|nr:nicotinate (nicotinamide) nucleotide adenylyltransferase [Gaiellales bacterium]
MSGLGVFGGQFDPPHLGHLAAVRAARDQLDLDVLVVPDGLPPHRSPSQLPAATRVALARAAFAGEPRVTVRAPASPLRRTRTVELLEAVSGSRRLFLILGADQWAGLEGWYRPDRIRELATLVVAPRPGVSVDGEDIRLLAMPAVDVSSTAVRDALSRGQDVRGLVPEAVADEIDRRRLYRAGPEPGAEPLLP